MANYLWALASWRRRAAAFVPNSSGVRGSGGREGLRDRTSKLHASQPVENARSGFFHQKDYGTTGCSCSTLQTQSNLQETVNQFRTANRRNHETNFCSEFQKPGCIQRLNNNLAMIGKWTGLLKQEAGVRD